MRPRAERIAVLMSQRPTCRRRALLISLACAVFRMYVGLSPGILSTMWPRQQLQPLRYPPARSWRVGIRRWRKTAPVETNREAVVAKRKLAIAGFEHADARKRRSR